MLAQKRSVIAKKLDVSRTAVKRYAADPKVQEMVEARRQDACPITDPFAIRSCT